MTYEDMLMEADHNHLITKEKPLRAHDGRIKGNRIAIRRNMTEAEKKCVLAEELGHYYTTAGNILEQQGIADLKQERHARIWAYGKLLNLFDIVRAYTAGCRSPYEMAEYLDVTEEFLLEALESYKARYGTAAIYAGEYYLVFEPVFTVMKADPQ